MVMAAMVTASCSKMSYVEVPVEIHDTTVVLVEAIDSTRYPWEQGRDARPAISDMVLCYGGSAIRKSTDWPASRFSEYVSYKDAEGKEHWLFDSFLALEWRYVDTDIYRDGSGASDPLDIPGKYGLTGGHDYRSAPKKGWQYMIDFWCAEDNGFGGLDKAVADAAARLGNPVAKRRVVMFLPDPLKNEYYTDKKSSTTYWGEVDGKTLDFSKDSDRLIAYRWYIDEVRAKFAERNFRNIELIGFYILAEDIKHPSESYTDYAELYDLIEPLANYLHSVGEFLYWIPYSSAPGRSRGWDLGIDYIWLQPNYYEHGSGYMDTAISRMINDGLGMEIEFDRKAFFKFDGQYDATLYSNRFKSYLDKAESTGLYGTKPFTYYIMTDTPTDVMELFRTSGYGKDKELYQRFCSFVANNPLKDSLR